ncbi:plexin domain-containing protein 2 isoform X2 [Nasonia vitripennis]|uniref:Plexin domain-containing protein 2 n=1 Tax=Nasonia vitripennis TaxID=7425 RepID=A0A7M7QTU8_NASVI|nr:plexin domain-containing protein 2 isoform X2 [Nasonia vitripennis]
MGNMACDQWCTRRSLIIFAILAFDLVATGYADAARNDLSHFHYTSLSSELSGLDHELEFELSSNRDNLLALDRRRRNVPSQPSTVPPAIQEQPPKSNTEAGSVQPSPQNQQPVMTKFNTSVNVSYSTQEQNVTSTLASVVATENASSVTSTTPQPVILGTAGKGVIVSTPIVPSTEKNVTGKVSNATATTSVTPSIADKSKIHVWANRTMWSNVTGANHPEGESDDALDEFNIDKYPAEVTNKTLQENNITKSQNDTHQYYNSTFTVDETIGKRYWIDLDNHPNRTVNTLLSKSHRRAATIKLQFDFPFYGHKVRNITIATGGFLYTGEYVHSWLAATQYIAPLMANFDTTLSSQSFVKYADNGTAFTVEWENVQLQDKPDAGAFTFQVTLLQNGDIIFVYSKIPVLVESIEDKEHPVKIGLSDAYMMDRTVFLARRKTIYEYHRVNFQRQDIKNWTVIYLKALPTCLQMDNCNDCLTKIKDFDCRWCQELQKCSTGTFRFRQDWLQKGCDIRNIRDEKKCPAKSTSYHEHVEARAEDHHADDMPVMTKYSPSQQAVGPASSSLEHSQDNMNMGVSGIIGILFVVSLIAGLAAWAAYAYRNPHSASGQMLIRYRPSQWSWRRGEARYTAATIHM